MLACLLACLLAYLLTYLLSFFLTYLLTYFLTYLLACLLACLLSFLLTYLLTYLLTKYSSGCQQLSVDYHCYTCVEQSCGVQQGVDDERRVPGGFQTVPRDELCHVPGR